jgi:hypothetical protein
METISQNRTHSCTPFYNFEKNKPTLTGLSSTITLIAIGAISVSISAIAFLALNSKLPGSLSFFSPLGSMGLFATIALTVVSSTVTLAGAALASILVFRSLQKKYAEIHEENSPLYAAPTTDLTVQFPTTGQAGPDGTPQPFSVIEIHDETTTTATTLYSALPFEHIEQLCPHETPQMFSVMLRDGQFTIVRDKNDPTIAYLCSPFSPNDTYIKGFDQNEYTQSLEKELQGKRYIAPNEIRLLRIQAENSCQLKAIEERLYPGQLVYIPELNTIVARRSLFENQQGIWSAIVPNEENFETDFPQYSLTEISNVLWQSPFQEIPRPGVVEIESFMQLSGCLNETEFNISISNDDNVCYLIQNTCFQKIEASEIYSMHTELLSQSKHHVTSIALIQRHENKVRIDTKNKLAERLMFGESTIFAGVLLWREKDDPDSDGAGEIKEIILTEENLQEVDRYSMNGYTMNHEHAIIMTRRVFNPQKQELSHVEEGSHTEEKI